MAAEVFIVPLRIGPLEPKIGITLKIEGATKTSPGRYVLYHGTERVCALDLKIEAPKEERTIEAVVTLTLVK